MFMVLDNLFQIHIPVFFQSFYPNSNGNQVEVYEDGLESRDFVYIDDVVEATVKAVLSESNVNGIFNVGSGIAISL